MASTCLTSQHPVGLGAPEAACSTLLSRSSCSRLITSIRKRSLQPAAVCRPIAARPSIQSLRDHPASWTRVATRRSRNPPLSPTAAPLSKLPTATGERFLSSRISHSGSLKAGLTSRGRLIPVAIGHSCSVKASGGSNGSCRSRSDVSADVPITDEASAEPSQGNPRDRRLEADGSRLRENVVEADEVQNEGDQGSDKHVEACGNCPWGGLQGMGVDETGHDGVEVQSEGKQGADEAGSVAELGCLQSGVWQGTGMDEEGVGDGDAETDQFVMRTLLIDNYDSYTFNLYHLLADVNGVPPVVVRNDEVSWPYLRDLLLHRRLFHAIVISPGPGTPCCPADIGVCADVLRECTDIPILGVCMGHQALAALNGGQVVPAPEPVHGRLSGVEHTGHPLFTNIPSGSLFQVVRYHSLAVHWASLPKDLEPIAWTTNDPLSTHIASPAAPPAAPRSVADAQVATGAMTAGSDVVNRPAIAGAAVINGAVNGATRGVQAESGEGTEVPKGSVVVVNGMVAPRQYHQQQHRQQQQEQLQNLSRVIMGLAHKRRPHVGVQ
ncbi:unnamed protein product, partial [Closterium sp. NIES-54]